MPPELSVIVPAYNEAENLAGVVEEIARVLVERLAGRAEIIVVDDGSTDGTGEVAAALRAAGRCAAVARHPQNRGLGAALRSGFAVASGELIGWLPADGQFRAEDLLGLLPSSAEADIVLGRMNMADRQASASLGRALLSRAFRLATRLILGEAPKLYGLILFRRKVLRDIALTSDSGFLDTELALRARRLGMRVRVAPFDIVPNRRLGGESKVTNVRTILVSLRDMTRLRWSGRWR
jgi:glycosyltransferase involved in cell wall biosynthesis